MNIWKRINYLRPKPLCSIKNNAIVAWKDPRPQPTMEEILAVDEATIDADNTAKQEAIEAELANNILNNKTFTDVETYIDNQFASATDAAAIKAVVIKQLKIYGKLILALAKRQGLYE